MQALRAYIGFFWLLLSGLKMLGQAPDVTCLQVGDFGDVTINWISPSATDFSHYEIITSVSPALDFTSVANSLGPLSLSSYSHSTDVTLNNSYYYAVLAWYNDGAGGMYSVSSDTLSTIHLEAEAAESICENCDSSAYLQWNEPWLPAGTDTENLVYQIWTDYPGNTWQLLETVDFSTNTYLKYVFNCSATTMNFRIRMVTSDGCEFVSNIDGDQFRDQVFPATGPLKKIELDANGDGFLEWEHFTSDDIVGYKIYRCTGGGTTQIGFVDSAPWQFLDPLANENGVNSYAIAAYDACGNTDTTSCRSSSFLAVIPYVVCDEAVIIDWTVYDGWNSAPDYYIVYKSFDISNDYNAVSLIPIDTVYTTEFYDYSLQFGGYSIYRVEAIDTTTGYRAFTNFADTYVNDYDAPEYVWIESANVLNNDSVQVTLGITPTALSFRYELQRFELATQTWEEVLVIDTSATMQLVFIDDQLATDVFFYNYRIVVYNTCGLPVDTSNIATTILLEGQSIQDRLVNTLRWSPYSDWVNGVDRYEIYRKLKDKDFELIDEMSGGASLFYQDDVSELVETDGDFTYRIRAIEKSDGTREPFFSNSNEVNLSINPIIWIPNAIVIGGYNDLFKPTISFAFVEEYYLVIFSRWGDLIFETRDIMEGWDGSMDGRMVQEGTYNYYITVKDGRGRAIDQFGFLTVLNYE